MCVKAMYLVGKEKSLKAVVFLDIYKYDELYNEFMNTEGEGWITWIAKELNLPKEYFEDVSMEFPDLYAKYSLKSDKERLVKEIKSADRFRIGNVIITDEEYIEYISSDTEYIEYLNSDDLLSKVANFDFLLFDVGGDHITCLVPEVSSPKNDVFMPEFKLTFPVTDAPFSWFVKYGKFDKIAFNISARKEQICPCQTSGFYDDEEEFDEDNETYNENRLCDTKFRLSFMTIKTDEKDKHLIVLENVGIYRNSKDEPIILRELCEIYKEITLPNEYPQKIKLNGYSGHFKLSLDIEITNYPFDK